MGGVGQSSEVDASLPVVSLGLPGKIAQFSLTVVGRRLAADKMWHSLPGYQQCSLSL